MSSSYVYHLFYSQKPFETFDLCENQHEQWSNYVGETFFKIGPRLKVSYSFTSFCILVFLLGDVDTSTSSF
jgi:hypothetical protein